MYIGGVTTTSRVGFAEQNGTGTKSSSNTHTSPSRISVYADRAAVAAARSANRSVWSRPFRLTRRTFWPCLYATMRQPSTSPRRPSPPGGTARRRGSAGCITATLVQGWYVRGRHGGSGPRRDLCPIPSRKTSGHENDTLPCG
jgi:hypothetical protein